MSAGQHEDMEKFREEAASMGVILSETQIEQFAAYQQMLLEWNQRLNLTAVRDARSVQQRHFLDSLSCAAVTGCLDGRQLVDVGTGAGFPGLPLKILNPELRLTLVESIAKKAAFLTAVVDKLGLSGVAVISARAEEMGQDPLHRERYDWAVARAVAELRILVEYLLPLCRPGGHVLAQKGKNVEDEAATAQQAINLLGGSPPTMQPIRLPGDEETHYLVLIEKLGSSPDKYPRRAGMPTKRPL